MTYKLLYTHPAPWWTTITQLTPFMKFLEVMVVTRILFFKGMIKDGESVRFGRVRVVCVNGEHEYIM